MAAPGIIVPGAPTPVGHYPHARRVGDLLYISGAGPPDAASIARFFHADVLQAHFGPLHAQAVSLV